VFRQICLEIEEKIFGKSKVKPKVIFVEGASGTGRNT
jgi:hypothetical protein